MQSELSRWWYLDLQADYPEIEMYCGGWKGEHELAVIELGDRVMNEETAWLFTWIYSSQRDRIWAGVVYMFRCAKGAVSETDPRDDWWPDLDKWDGDKHYMEG